MGMGMRGMTAEENATLPRNSDSCVELGCRVIRCAGGGVMNAWRGYSLSTSISMAVTLAHRKHASSEQGSRVCAGT